MGALDPLDPLDPLGWVSYSSDFLRMGDALSDSEIDDALDIRRDISTSDSTPVLSPDSSRVLRNLAIPGESSGSVRGLLPDSGDSGGGGLRMSLECKELLFSTSLKSSLKSSSKS